MVLSSIDMRPKNAACEKSYIFTRNVSPKTLAVCNKEPREDTPPLLTYILTVYQNILLTIDRRRPCRYLWSLLEYPIGTPFRKQNWNKTTRSLLIQRHISAGPKSKPRMTSYPVWQYHLLLHNHPNFLENKGQKIL